MSKIQNKAYLKILHNLSFPKSPKTLNLDKPNKSYKRYGGRDLTVKGKDLNKAKGPIRAKTRDLHVKSTKLRAC